MKKKLIGINICGIMSHRIGDAWNLFLLFKENRMGNDR